MYGLNLQCSLFALASGSANPSPHLPRISTNYFICYGRIARVHYYIANYL